MLVALPDRCVFTATEPRGEPAVVKVDTKPWRSAKERLLLESARAGGVPVPGVLYADDGQPAILVCEHADGTELTADSPGSARTSAGRVLRRLHAMDPVPGLGVMAEPGDSPRAMLITKAAAEATVAAQAGLLTRGQAGRIRVMLVTAFFRCRLLRYLGELIWLNDNGFETRAHRELLGAASASGSLPPDGLDSGA